MPGALQAYRDKVADLAKGARGLSVQQLVQVREMINELIGSIPVDADLVAHLSLRQAGPMVAGGGFVRSHTANLRPAAESGHLPRVADAVGVAQRRHDDIGDLPLCLRPPAATAC